MKLKFCITLFIAATIASTANASVVVYEEGIQTQAYSIEKIGNAEIIILSDCPLDQPLANLDTCEKQKGLMPTSQLKNLVRAAALKAAVYHPDEDLSPIHREQLSDWADLQANPDETNNQKKLKELDYAFSDLTDTLLDFIRHNGANGSPQTIRSSAMKNTLILQVMRRLAVADMTPDKLTGGKIPADTKLGQFIICANINSINHPIWALYPNGKAHEIEDTTSIDPVVMALEDAVFIVSIQNGSIRLDSIGNQPAALPSSQGEEFMGVSSFTLDRHQLKLIAYTKDGSSFQRFIDLDKSDHVKGVSEDWDFLY